MEAVKLLLKEFVTRANAEEGLLYYEFTLNGDEVFCREAYVDAMAALTHLANVGEQLQAMLALSSLIRLEIHGRAAELDQLRGPLGAFNPAWFILECGVAA